MAPPKKYLADFLERHGTTVEDFLSRYAYTEHLTMAGWAWEFYRRAILVHPGGGYNEPPPLVGDPSPKVHAPLRYTWSELEEHGETDRALSWIRIERDAINPIPWKSEAYRRMKTTVRRRDDTGNLVTEEIPPGDGTYPYWANGDGPLTDSPQLDLAGNFYSNRGIRGAFAVHRYPLVTVDLDVPLEVAVQAFREFFSNAKKERRNEAVERREPPPRMERPDRGDSLTAWYTKSFLPIWDLTQRGAPPAAILREFFGWDGDIGTRDEADGQRREVLRQCEDLIFGERGKELRAIMGGGFRGNSPP